MRLERLCLQSVWGSSRPKHFCVLSRANRFPLLGFFNISKASLSVRTGRMKPEIKAGVFRLRGDALLCHMAGGPCEKGSGDSSSIHSSPFTQNSQKCMRARDSSLVELYGVFCAICMSVCECVCICVCMWVSVCEIDKYTIFTRYATYCMFLVYLICLSFCFIFL